MCPYREQSSSSAWETRPVRKGLSSGTRVPGTVSEHSGGEGPSDRALMGTACKKLPPAEVLHRARHCPSHMLHHEPRGHGCARGYHCPHRKMGRQRHAGGGNLPARSSGQSPAPRGPPHMQSLSEPPATPRAGRANPPLSWVKTHVRSENADGDSSVLIQLLLPWSGSRGHS